MSNVLDNNGKTIKPATLLKDFEVLRYLLGEHRKPWSSRHSRMREFSSEMYSYGRYYTYDRAREWFGCANDSPWELPSTESARDLESLSGYFLIRKWVYRSIRVLKRQMEWHPDEAIRIVPWQEDGRYGKDGLHMELRLPERVHEENERERLYGGKPYWHQFLGDLFLNKWETVRYLLDEDAVCDIRYLYPEHYVHVNYSRGIFDRIPIEPIALLEDTKQSSSAVGGEASADEIERVDWALKDDSESVNITSNLGPVDSLQQASWNPQLLDDLTIASHGAESTAALKSVKHSIEEIKISFGAIGQSLIEVKESLAANTRPIEEAKASIEEIKQSLTELKESLASSVKPSSVESDSDTSSENGGIGLSLAQEGPLTEAESVVGQPLVGDEFSVAESSVVEATGEPYIELPVTVEAVLEEPIVEEPIVEEPIIKGINVNESNAGDLSARATNGKNSIIGEPLVEEPVIGESVNDSDIIEKAFDEESVAEQRQLIEEQTALEGLLPIASSSRGTAHSVDDSLKSFGHSSEYNLNANSEIDQYLTHSQRSSSPESDISVDNVDAMIHFPDFGSQSASVAVDFSNTARELDQQDDASSEASGQSQPTPDSSDSLTIVNSDGLAREAEDLSQSFTLSTAIDAPIVDTTAVVGSNLSPQSRNDNDWEMVEEVENGEEFSLNHDF